MNEKSETKLKDYAIFAKGYGIASKYILCDPGLSIASKGDYCYKRSLCGRNDESVCPGVFKIMEDLNISKKLYYKVRGELLNAGIIIIKRNKNNGEFDNNYYEFPLQPSRYMVATDDPYIQSVSADIRQFGVMAKYGLCPYYVMSEKELSVGAKVLFAYISAHINVSEKPYVELDPKLILYHMSMSPNTYKKYLAELKHYNLITVQRVRTGGAFKPTNLYAINYTLSPVNDSSVPVDIIAFPTSNAPTTPKEETVAAPTTKKEETVNAPATKKEETVAAPMTKKEETVDEPTTKKEETVNAPTTKKGEMKKGETKKEETTITSSTITSLNQIFIDRWIETIRKKIEYRVICFVAEDYPPLKQATDLLVETIVETMTSPNLTTIINGESLLTESVRNVLMQVNNNVAMIVLNRCLSKQDKIRNMKAYLLTCLYNEINFPTQEVEEEYEEAF